MSNLSSITPGATIERVYWAVPDHYTGGTEFDTRAEALAHAIDERKGQIARHLAHYGSEKAARAPHPERVDIDLRWYVKVENGHVDIVAERETYQTIEGAERALDLARRFAA